MKKWKCLICGEIVEIVRAGSLDGVEDRLARLEKLHRDVLETTTTPEPETTT